MIQTSLACLAATRAEALLGRDFTPPSHGGIPVAVVLGPGATVIDFAGPWEVFQDAIVESGSNSNQDSPFTLYTVSDDTKPLRASAGLVITPQYDFATAPKPKVIVIGAQGGHTQEKLGWIREASKTADLTMSVCTGAFLLAETGLLAGKSATTHHDFYNQFEKAFPNIMLKRGTRYVENDNLATSGGLASGIHLALRVVERYFGRPAMTRTAEYMEFKA